MSTTATAARVHEADSTHWYASDGTPCYEILGRNGKMRNVTLADARKGNLLPSVTNILGVIAKPALESWKVEQGCLAVLTAPRLAGEDLDAFVKRVLHDEQEHKAEAAAAADLGTDTHRELARWLAHLLDPEWTELTALTAKAREWITSEFLSKGWLPERIESVVVSRPFGYAGMLDLELGNPRFMDSVIVDWKTAKNLPDGPLGWPEHGEQLAAYALGLHPEKPEGVRRINCYIATADKEGQRVGDIRVCEWPVETFKPAMESFLGACSVWKARKGYWYQPECAEEWRPKAA